MLADIAVMMPINVRLPMAVATTAAVGGLGALLYSRADRLAGPEIFFGLTVPTGTAQTEIAKRITSRYRKHVTVNTLVAMFIACGSTFVQSNWAWPALLLIPWLWQAIAAGHAFSASRNQAMSLAVRPSSIREIDLHRRRLRLPGDWIGQCAALLPLLVASLILIAQWDHLPARFPTHWNLDGQPNRWAMRTPMAVFLPIAIGLGSCVIAVLSAATVSIKSRRLAGTGREFGEHYLNKMMHVVFGIELCLSLIFSAIALQPLLQQLWPEQSTTLARWLIPLTVVALPAILGLIARQIVRNPAAGSAVNRQDSNQPTGDGTPDRAWKWGIFYINRDDPAIFVRKRFGFGYTANLASVWPWIAIAACLFGVVGVKFMISTVLRQ